MGKAKIEFLHPKEDGSGSSMSVEMHYQTDERPGFLRLRFAKQNGTAFDGENGISCDLDFDATSMVMQVLNGNDEKVNGGKPLALSDGLMFAMKSVHEPDGFAFAAVRKFGTETRNVNIVLKPHEAQGLLCALEHAMFFISFIKGVNA